MNRPSRHIDFARQRARSGRKLAGFSLIEVLVTMVILAFGLLGIAGLMVGGISNASASEALSKAHQLAADMADRIRANPAAALSATSEYVTKYEDDAPTTPTTIAQADKKAWIEALAAQLPQGAGRITNTVGAGQRKIEIEVRWSNCLGTLSDAERTDCTDNPATAFRTVSLELRL
ncbi:MAG: Type IV fimbrial biogenesis protein PilV [Burkholderiaceae bacterium]|jgi:type IV pilus assembly protein PilV|nr:MAG: Type IV fimbrial biogenesis protein PilV [Burkholderiaceae bacterium]